LGKKTIKADVHFTCASGALFNLSVRLKLMKKKNKIDTYQKAKNILKDFYGVFSNNFDGSKPANEKTVKAITDALVEDFGQEKAKEIAFHLTDWGNDAAFILALHLFPEKFSKDEIEKGIYQFLPHVPDHLAAASKLFGTPVTDVFDVGALDGADNHSG